MERRTEGRTEGWKAENYVPPLFFEKAGDKKMQIEPRHEKTNVVVSNLVRHKPGYTATEGGYTLEISDLESRGIVLSM